MTWRLRVSHRTAIRYEGEVQASYNEARMTPLTELTQTTLDARLEISPSAAVARYWDYWGSYVTAFDVHVPHAELVLTASSVVETAPDDRADPGASWDELREDRFRDAHVEYLTPTEHTTVAEDLVEQARAVAGSLPPDAAAREVLDWLGDHLQYVPGATGVHTLAMEAWVERKGVCQDFAHLGTGMLRGLGIPARYVSGYLHPNPDADRGETVSGESHAWVECWDGAWTAHDPTNRRPVGPEHVVVARGRDYWDVPPHKGVYSGPAGSAIDVEVQVTRLA